MIEFNSSPNPTIGVEIELQIKLNVREAINNLCKFVESSSTFLGSSKYIKTIQEILNQGTGATKQRKLYNSSNNFEYMLQYLKKLFYAQ